MMVQFFVQAGALTPQRVHAESVFPAAGRPENVRQPVLPICKTLVY